MLLVLVFHSDAKAWMPGIHALIFRVAQRFAIFAASLRLRSPAMHPAMGPSRAQIRDTVRPALALMISVGVGAPAWADDCKQLQERRDQLAQQAMAAEVALVHRQRQQLCPKLEALATRDSAEVSPQLDYGAYIRCRQKAEAELRNSQTVQYRNSADFPFFTKEGARLAREADALQQAVLGGCADRDRPGLNN